MSPQLACSAPGPSCIVLCELSGPFPAGGPPTCRAAGLVQGTCWKLRGAMRSSHGAGKSALPACTLKTRGDPHSLWRPKNTRLKIATSFVGYFVFPQELFFFGQLWEQRPHDVSFFRVTPERICVDGGLPTQTAVGRPQI